MTPKPLLILSDSPSCSSGLGRITRDLALRLHEHCSDIFCVGTLGYGGSGSRALGFQQYFIEGMDNWYIPSLRDVWEDFAGTEQGILLTIWDASRLLWFARPTLQVGYGQFACGDPGMREWLEKPPFERWAYFPVDAAGPNGKLSCMLRECMLGYDRVLAYSKWAEDLMRATLGEEEAEQRDLTFLPHGIDTEVFRRRPRRESRQIFAEKMGFKGPEISPYETLVGIVATNQERKDYGLAIQAFAELSKKVQARLFIQTDTLERRWSIPALLIDFGLMRKAIVNCGQVTDETMSYVYSACDVTLGIGAGEGFGYPIFESLACETPCVTGRYGGHAEWLESDLLLTPESRRLDGCYNCYRPVYRPADWVKAIFGALDPKKKRKLPAGLAWPDLWPQWEKWFRAGQIPHLLGDSQADCDNTPEMGKDESGPSRPPVSALEVMPETQGLPVYEKQDP